MQWGPSPASCTGVYRTEEDVVSNEPGFVDQVVGKETEFVGEHGSMCAIFDVPPNANSVSYFDICMSY